MKFFQILFCLLITASVVAQKNHNVYLNTASYEYLNDSAQELDQLIAAIKGAHEDNNFNLASQSKAQLLSLIYKSASASHSLCNIVEMSIQSEDLIPERYEEMTDEDYDLIMSKDKYHFAALVSTDEAGQLTQSVKRIYEIKDQLSNNSFQVHPNQENTLANISLLTEFASLLKETTNIYNSAKSRT